MKNTLQRNNVEISLNEVIKNSLERKNYENFPMEYTSAKK